MAHSVSQLLHSSRSLSCLEAFRMYL